MGGDTSDTAEQAARPRQEPECLNHACPTTLMGNFPLLLDQGPQLHLLEWVSSSPMEFIEINFSVREAN